MSDLMGYANPKYALSLQGFGEPRALPHCGGWILERPIPGTSYKDGMGCYPLFSCRDWFKLNEDLKELESELVSLVLVTDPFAAADHAYLERCFQIVRPFKRHLIADLSQDFEHFVNKHHRYYARASLRDLQVEISDEPVRYVNEWIELYANLVKRHSISGIRAFSEDSFRAQMQTPGMILVVGRLGGEIIGAHMIAIQGDVAYSHLAAFSDAAHRHSASYGIYWMALKYLTEHKIRFFDLGAAAGIDGNAQDGLAKFKAGWSNDSRTVYLCGAVLERHKYNAICQEKNIGSTDYFPAYRRGEFF
jgi:Acetyltransferase (GNAT) domain